MGSDVKEKIRKFIIDEFMPEGSNLDDNEPLFENGIIDSLGLIKLSTFIGDSFGVVINPSDVSMDNFDNIEKIDNLISGKLEK